MAKIIDFSKAKVQAISSGTILLFLYKNGETVQMSRSFMQMHEGLENVSVGDELEVVLKDSGKVAPNNRIYRYIGEIAERVDVRENINNEFKASFLNKVIGRAVAAGNNARQPIDIYVGVQDNGEISGLNATVKDCDQAEASWSNELAQVLDDPGFVYSNITWDWKLTTKGLLYLILHVKPSGNLLWLCGNILPVRHAASSPILQGRDIESFIINYYQNHA